MLFTKFSLIWHKVRSLGHLVRIQLVNKLISLMAYQRHKGYLMLKFDSFIDVWS